MAELPTTWDWSSLVRRLVGVDAPLGESVPTKLSPEDMAKLEAFLQEQKTLRAFLERQPQVLRKMPFSQIMAMAAQEPPAQKTDIRAEQIAAEEAMPETAPPASKKGKILKREAQSAKKRLIKGYTPEEWSPIWNVQHDPDISAAVKKTAQTRLLARIGPEEVGARIASRMVRSVIPAMGDGAIPTNVIDEWVRNDLSASELKRIARVGTGSKVRALFYNMMNAKKRNSPLAYNFMGYLSRGPTFTTGGGEVDWTEFPRKDLRRRWVEGQPVRTRAEPIQRTEGEWDELTARKIHKEDIAVAEEMADKEQLGQAKSTADRAMKRYNKLKKELQNRGINITGVLYGDSTTMAKVERLAQRDPKLKTLREDVIKAVEEVKATEGGVLEARGVVTPRSPVAMKQKVLSKVPKARLVERAGAQEMALASLDDLKLTGRIGGALTAKAPVGLKPKLGGSLGVILLLLSLAQMLGGRDGERG